MAKRKAAPKAGAAPKRGRGRPEIPLTEELKKKVCNALAAGLPREFACALADVSLRTVNRWRARGEKDRKGVYREFCREFKKAEAVYAAKTLDAMDKIGAGKYDSDHAPQWTALAWRLERRFPKHFGRRDTTTHKIGKGAAKAAQLVLVEGPAKIDPPDEMP